MLNHEHGETEIAPSNATLSSYRRTQWWTSWHVCFGGLLLALVIVVVVLAIPFVRREQALRYFDEHRVECIFVQEDLWITETFGDWARSFCRVEGFATIDPPSDEELSYMAIFDEVGGS